jgi:hypothetical protein
MRFVSSQGWLITAFYPQGSQKGTCTMVVTTDSDNLQQAIAIAITEDWELIKDTAGAVADRKSIFELAYRFGWHAAGKYLRDKDGDDNAATSPR